MTVSKDDGTKIIYEDDLLPVRAGDPVPIPFSYTEKTDIYVVVDKQLWEYGVDYTIEETIVDGDVVSRTLYPKHSIANGSKLTVFRQTPVSQEAEFPQNKKFVSEKMNEALDKICREIQEHEEILERCLKISIDLENSNINVTLPDPVPLNLFRWNANADGLENYDIDAEFEKFRQEVRRMFAELEARLMKMFEDLEAEIRAKFAALERELKAAWEAFKREIYARMDAVELRMDNLEAEVNRFEQEIRAICADLSARVAAIEANYVTTDTDQTITGKKIIPNLYYDEIRNYLIAHDFGDKTGNPVQGYNRTNSRGGQGVGYQLFYDTDCFSVKNEYDLTLSNAIKNRIEDWKSQVPILIQDNGVTRTTKLLFDNNTLKVDNDTMNLCINPLLVREIHKATSNVEELNTNLTTERTEREAQDISLQNQLDARPTVDNIKAGNNIELIKDGNDITINSTGGSDLELYEGENIKFTYSTISFYSDGSMNVNDFLRNKTGNRIGLQRVNSIEELNRTKNSYYSVLRDTDFYVGDVYYNIELDITYSSQIRFNMSLDGMYTSSKFYTGYNTNNLSEVEPTNKWDTGALLNINMNHNIYKITNVSLMQDYSMTAINCYIRVPDVSKITINSTGGGAIIDDETVSTDKVFSSSRTSELVGEVGNDLQDLAQRVNDIESLKVPNVVIIGEPMIQNGQVSDLDEQNHLQFPWIIERKGRVFSCEFEFTTGADVTRQQNIIDSRCSVAVAVRNSRIVWALSSNGQTFDIESEVPMNIRPYTTYYCRLYKRAAGNNYGYTLTVGYNEDEAHVSNSITLQDFIYPTTMTIGSDGNSFDGVIDLNKWSLKIDNDLVWLGMDNVGQAVSANVSLSNINEAGVKVINDLIDAKIGDINTILDNINGEVI